MLGQLLPFCFIHESVWSFLNIGETSSTGTAQNGACANWRGSGYYRLPEASVLIRAKPEAYGASFDQLARKRLMAQWAEKRVG